MGKLIIGNVKKVLNFVKLKNHGVVTIKMEDCLSFKKKKKKE